MAPLTTLKKESATMFLFHPGKTNVTSRVAVHICEETNLQAAENDEENDERGEREG